MSAELAKDIPDSSIDFTCSKNGAEKPLKMPGTKVHDWKDCFEG